MKTKLIIFGITGHLAQNKLLPALANVIESGKCDELSIIGVSRKRIEQFEVLGQHHAQLSGTTSMFHMDLNDAHDYMRLKEYVDQQPGEQLLFYLSVPPLSVGNIIENLGAAGFNSPMNKLLLEKPFGTGLESAKSMISHTSRYFKESEVYRIDHYLAKEMAQNIVMFRAQNSIFSSLWNNQYIERIEINALESADIEGRSEFYEQTGALRDIVQGHLLQLLSLVLLPLPQDEAFDWDSLPSRRLDALKAVNTAEIANAHRAQYDGYGSDANNVHSLVETFVLVRLFSSDPTWAGVPMLLTTGKALDHKCTEVKIFFRHNDYVQGNDLTFKIQPEEGIEIDLVTKKPGYDQDSEQQKLIYHYPANAQLPDAYEQVLVDAISSRKSLFASSDEVLRAWEILEPIQSTWRTENAIIRYPKNSSRATVMQIMGHGQ